MPPSPHRLFASIVVAGMSLAGCSSSPEPGDDAGRATDAGRDAATSADAGRLADAGSAADAGQDVGDAGGCEHLDCEPCDPRPVCDLCAPCII